MLVPRGFGGDVLSVLLANVDKGWDYLDPWDLAIKTILQDGRGIVILQSRYRFEKNLAYWRIVI